MLFSGTLPAWCAQHLRFVLFSRQVCGAIEFWEAECADLSLSAMVQADWRQQDRLDATVRSYAAATAGHLEKAALLLADLRQDRSDDFPAAEARRLEQLAAEAERQMHRRRTCVRPTDQRGESSASWWLIGLSAG